MRCAGCGAVPPVGDPYGWVCPSRDSGQDIDHVMVDEFDVTGLPFVTSDDENPFVRYRALLHSYHRWIAAGHDDASFIALVSSLDRGVASIDGHGFRRTPLVRASALDAAVGGARVWVKDETGNIAGSHKGRHLFGLMILLQVVAAADAPLAIASCGNAALAAAVVAAAAGRHLEVFIPVGADPGVVARLGALGARVNVCPRDAGAAGDPCYRAFRAAVGAGAIPFGCQGPDNGLTIDGGQTLAWEVAEARPSFDRLVIQVGGGALASACIQGLGRAVDLGALPSMPVVDTVQSTGAYPLARAFTLVVAGSGIRRFMWPWETPPVSVAHGILDDEAYDWRAVVEGMLATGGSAVVAEEATLVEANRLGRNATGLNVDETGTAGLAGLLTLARSGLVDPDSDVVVVFTGCSRGRPADTEDLAAALSPGQPDPRTRRPGLATAGSARMPPGPAAVAAVAGGPDERRDGRANGGRNASR